MENQLSFTEMTHKLGEVTLLDEYSRAVMTPDGFKDIVLYPHQATVVDAMCDLEDKRVLIINNVRRKQGGVVPVALRSSAMVLSEPFGSGKTIEILAMILRKPIPKAFPEEENSIIWNKSKNRMASSTSYMEIQRRFIGADALIRANLIVVGSSVLIQWQNAIKEFCPRLKFITIADKHGVDKFIELFTSGRLKAFDIVLLKNGTCTGNLVLEGENRKELKEQRSLINVVRKITRNHCWARVFYDDFDTIKIPPDSGNINALFTVYVSATTKAAPTVKHTAVKTYKNVIDALRDHQSCLSDALDDKLLFTNFNIRNEKIFVDRSTNIPIIKKYVCVYDNPDDNYIRLIGAMGAEDANAIMEMLNGDAIATAAKAMGTESTSVADIFQRLLDQKYDKYMNDKYVLETIVKTKRIHNSADYHPEGKSHTVVELEACRGKIVKRIVPEIKYRSDRMAMMLDDLNTEYTQYYEEDGLAVNRVIDNLKEGDCQICCMPLSESNAFIVRCCGLILCDTCGIKGNQIRKSYDYKLKAEVIRGACSNCKKVIYPQRDLIFVDRKLNIETLLNARGDEKPAELAVEEPDEASDEPKIKNPKLKALLDIIRGRMPENATANDRKIPHLLEGKVDKPAPADMQRKVLVFANYSETLVKIETFLGEQGIEYMRLQGKAAEMAETVRQFKNRGTVLLINSQQYCAGLNLAFCTDGVFFHKILDANIESQVAGRLQRIGRTVNANLWSLHYKNEKFYEDKHK